MAGDILCCFCILLMIFHWCHYMQFPLKSLVVVVIYVISYRSNQTKDGNTVNVRYCLYDNGAKTDADGNSCEELVLEKVYPDGNYETELVDFYLVNTDTMQVTDEQKNTW